VLDHAAKSLAAADLARFDRPGAGRRHLPHRRGEVEGHVRSLPIVVLDVLRQQASGANVPSLDYNSNVDRIVDQVLSGHDVDFTMDGLDRLTKAEEGTWSGSAIINRTRQEIWTLTQTGNWANHKLDRNGNNVFTDSGDLDETGTFNAANEVTQRDLWSNGQQIKTPTHDRVGNMTDDGEAFKYIYDPFGRLSVMNSLTPFRPRSFRCRRKVRQDSASSFVPSATPSTSR
jgi:hypothetical protein